MAVRHGQTQMVELLLEKNSFVDAVDSFGNSVFFYAVNSGSTELILVD